MKFWGWLAAIACSLAGPASAQIRWTAAVSDWTPAPTSPASPTSPGARQASGTNVYGYSDCSSENMIGLTGGGELVWMTQFSTDDHGLDLDALVEVKTAWGSAMFPGQSPGNYTRTAYYYIWEDTDDDDSPLTGLECVDSGQVFPEHADTDTKEPVELFFPVQVESEYYVGFSWYHDETQLAAALDLSQPSTDPNTGRRRSWITGNQDFGFNCDDLFGQGSIGVFEMDAFGMPSVWLTEAVGDGQPTRIYCTAKTALVCGPPALEFTGAGKAGLSCCFEIRALPVRNQRFGVLLYSLVGPAALPFDGGLLCVDPSGVKRTSIVHSAGSPPPADDCTGVLRIDFNRFASGQLGGHPDPALLIPGTEVWAQWWGRDGLVTGNVLSAGIHFWMK